MFVYSKMVPDDSEKLVLSVAEVRKKLGLSKGSIYEAVRSGQIPSIRFGRRILIPVASLHRLLEDPRKWGMPLGLTNVADCAVSIPRTISLGLFSSRLVDDISES